jgi:cytochrome c
MRWKNHLVIAALTVAWTVLAACDTTAQEQAAPAKTPQPATTAGATTGASGQVKFNNFCRTCHAVREGDNRLGPSLHGIVGRKAGSAEGYGNYSAAMKQSGIVWDEATLDRFLANPEAVVPNNNMKPFARLADAAVRKQIIDYLETTGQK